MRVLTERWRRRRCWCSSCRSAMTSCARRCWHTRRGTTIYICPTMYMYVCMYVSIYLYIYIYIYIQVLAHKTRYCYIYVSYNIYIHTHILIYAMHRLVHVCSDSYIYIYIYIFIYTYVHVCVCVYACEHIYICTYIYIIYMQVASAYVSNLHAQRQHCVSIRQQPACAATRAPNCVCVHMYI